MSETRVTGAQPLVDPVAVGPGDGAPPSEGRGDGPPPAEGHGDGPPTAVPAEPAPALVPSGADASLLALIDRLAGVLERTELGELEVATGGTTIVLRAPSAVERIAVAAPTAAADMAPQPGTGPSSERQPDVGQGPTPAPPARPSVKAPLTGIYYGAPSPGATAYVAVGDHVAVGQIIGLIEAMKLFNEIKSDLAGRVVRICADNGALVKAKQPLIEVEPA